MSAFNVFIDDGEAFLFSDTCLYTPDGEIRSYTNKTYPLPTHRAAFGGRGAHALKLAMLAVIETTSPAGETFDALSDRLEAVFEEALLQVAPHANGQWSIQVELFFVGWSDREQKMKGYVLFNRDWNGSFLSGKSELEPCGFIDCPDISGTDFEIDMDRIGNFTAKDVPTIGVLIMDRQRQMIARDVPANHIDGEVMLTHVTRDAVTMRSLHRWEPGAAPLFPV